MTDLFSDPEKVCRHLASDEGPVYVEEASVVTESKDVVIIECLLRPMAAFEREGYPRERVRIMAGPQTSVRVVPLDAQGRTWHHRQPSEFGELCLWYPDDPRPLRWEWEDGPEALLGRTLVHLLAEEYARRHGRWPPQLEDAPHGRPAGRAYPPIRSDKMRRLAAER